MQSNVLADKIVYPPLFYELDEKEFPPELDGLQYMFGTKVGMCMQLAMHC